MATTDEKIISLGVLSYNNDKMKEYIQEEIDKIPSSAVDDTLSDTSEHPVQNKVIKAALDEKASIEQGEKADTAVQSISIDGVEQTKNNGNVNLPKYPTSLPANGGNAATVNSHTVESDVPADAKFTDTVYTHPTSGVAAGSYKSVTVDNKGHVTSGSNPTTLSGYGITDAAAKSHTHDDRYYTESEVNTKLNAKLDTSLKGAANGLAELDSSGKVKSTQLPTILALGETSSTAYRGDRGKIAYDHSQTAHAPSDAEANVQSDWNVTDTTSDAFIKNKPTSLPASDVKAWAKADVKPTYTASEVGADALGSANTALSNAKSYTDTKIADLINGAPTTLDTLGEIAEAMAESQSVVDALDSAIGAKANTEDLTAHMDNKSNPHAVTKSQVGLGDVPNVSTNNQTPTYTESTTLANLVSGEKLSIALGKISKAITDLISHIGDTVKHITSTERANWNAAKTHADSTHARTDATKVEASETNGKIKINSIETTVYTHPSGTNPHGTTKSDIGLENVGNFKAVSTVANQGLTETEKSNARTNIGAGTSSFSGNYNDLTNKPTIPDAVTESTVSGWGFTKNTGTYSKPSGGIPKSDLATDVQTSLGKADSALQEHQSLADYVKTTDSRLSDARMPTAHTHSKSEITDFPESLPANGGNADTVGGLPASSFYPAKNACISGGDYDTLVLNGIYEIIGNADNPTKNSPNRNEYDNNFFVQVFRRSSEYITQIAISARLDGSVFIRTMIQGTWRQWTSFFISNKPLVTGVATTDTTIHLKWLPVNGATKYAVSKYNSGTNYSVCSSTITDTEYTITGLTAGTEYNILVQAYIDGAWSTFTKADHVIARTTPIASGTAVANTTNCPVGAWYGQHS